MKKTSRKERPYGFWNWGTGIAIVIIVAASAMIFLVYKSMNVKFDMAEENYYAEELKVNQKKDARKNARNLSKPVSVQQTEDFVFISFPRECVGKKLDGSVKFYRPSAEDKDVLLPLALDAEGRLTVSKDQLINGQYKIIVDWQMNDTEYRVEEPLFLEKH